MKRRYKVLPLDFPFTCDRGFWDNDCVGEQITPRFNRDGRYWDRKTKEEWVEIDGEAWLLDGEMFMFDLDRSENERRLTECVYQALNTLFCTSGTGVNYKTHPDLFNLWDIENFIREMRRIVVNTRLHYLKFMKTVRTEA
jgi:hypothetical protein